MPKFICKCEEVINLSDIPCKNEYKFMSDVELDEYHGEINVEELYLKMGAFLKCPKCGRLWIYWDGFYDKEPQEFLPVNE